MNRKYAVLPSKLMSLFGELCGYHDLDDQVYQVIAEDATFRLNEVLNQSENLKRRVNKETLDVGEVNLMLKCCNVRPIEGYASSDRNQIRSILDDRQQPIDLIDESNRLLNKRQYVRVRSTKIRCEYANLRCDNLNEPIEQGDLPEASKKYYRFLIANLFSCSPELFERILKDLSSNDRLNDLISHLINHLNQRLDFISTDRCKLAKLVQILESLIANAHLQFKLQHSLIHLIDLSLDCLLNDHLKFDLDFLFKFRHCSANLLRSIVSRFQSIMNDSKHKLLIQILNLLLNRFIESSKLDIKYGIMILFQNLNPFILFEILFPFIMNFARQLDYKLTSKTIDRDEQYLFSSILLCLVSCFNFVINSNRIQNSSEFDVNQYYLEIYDVYGDSFINQIASNDSNFIKIIPRKMD